MGLDPKFAAAFIDGERGLHTSGTRILGVRLRKFCLWHRLLLRAIDSPFLVEKSMVTMLDLRRAVGVCRLRYGDSNIVLPRLIPFLVTVGVILRSLFRRRSALRAEKENAWQRAIRAQCGAFLEYAGSYLQKPEYSIIPPKQSGTTAMPRGRAPEELEHAGDLIRFGFDEVRAWEMSIGAANWWRALAQRAAGCDVDFVTPSEKQFCARLPKEFRRNAR